MTNAQRRALQELGVSEDKIQISEGLSEEEIERWIEDLQSQADYNAEMDQDMIRWEGETFINDL